MIGAMGYVFGMIGWRRPERALKVTAREALPNLGMGAVIGMLVLLLYREE